MSRNNNFSEVENEALGLLSCALFNAPMPELEDFPQVYDLLKIHATETLVTDCLKSISELSDDARSKYVQAAVSRINRNERVFENQSSLIKILDAEDISYAVIKGIAASQYYPSPLYRTCGDVDFLINPEYADEIRSLLESQGYRYHNEFYNERHWNFLKDGTEFEMHLKLGFPLNDGMEEKLDKAFALENINPKRISVEGYEAKVYPDLENGIILLCHFAAHFRAVNVGLRQLIDWCVFADRVLCDELWESGFCDLCKSYGLEALAQAMTRTGVLYLGLDEDKFRFSKAADDEICEMLMKTVLANGNFGRRLPKQSAGSVGLIMNNRNPISWLKTMQKHGLMHLKDMKAPKICYPFAWIYQFFRYVHKVTARKNSGKVLSSDFKKSKEMRQIFDALNIKYKQ